MSLLELAPTAFPGVPASIANGAQASLVCLLAWLPLGAFLCGTERWLPAWQMWTLAGCCIAIVALPVSRDVLDPAKRPRRRSFLAMTVIVTITFCLGLYFAALSEARTEVPIGLVDAPANESVIASLEQLVKNAPSDEARLLAGLCNQEAGRLARAKQLFEELGPSDRKEEVLSTLRVGRPPRLDLINDDLIIRASSRAWHRIFWSMLRGSEGFTRDCACVFLILLVCAWSLHSRLDPSGLRFDAAESRITWATSFAPGLPSFLCGRVGAAAAILFGVAAAGMAFAAAMSGLWPGLLGNSSALGVFWPPGPALGASARLYWLGSGLAALTAVKAAALALLAAVAVAITLQVRDSRALLHEWKPRFAAGGSNGTEPFPA